MVVRFYRKDDIYRLEAEGFIYISIVTTLAVVFAIYQVRDIVVEDWISKVDAASLLRLLLAFYYACWVAGCSVDLVKQRIVYLHDPKQERSRLSSIGAVALLAVVAALLYWSRDDETRFAFVLTSLLIVNFGLWRYLLFLVRPIIKASKRTYLDAEDFIGLERLRAVERYIDGRWQLWRFFFMAVIVLMFDVVVFFDQIREFLVALLSSRWASVPRGALSAIIPVLFFFSFVVLAEFWIWFVRFGLQIRMATLSDVGQKYKLVPES